MNNSPSYFKVHRQSATEKEFDPQIWDKSLEHYNQGHVMDAITHLLHYLEPTKVPLGQNIQNKTFQFQHGSAKISFSVSAEQYTIKSPFVTFTDQTKVLPIMRKVLEINGSDLMLAQIKLENQTLYFEFMDSFKRSHPNKILDILREISFCADYYDDLFIKEYGAKAADPVDLKALAADDLANAHTDFQNMVRELLEHVKDCEQKGYLGSIYDLCAGHLARIHTILKPQGYLRSALIKLKNDLNRRLPLDQKITDAKVSFEKLLTLTKEQLGESLYEAPQLIPDQSYIQVEEFQNWYENENWLHPYIVQFRANQEFQKAALSQLFQVHQFLRSFFLPKNIVAHLENALASSARKPWREASNILWDATHQAYEMEDAEEDDASEEEFNVEDYYAQAMKLVQQYMKS